MLPMPNQLFLIPNCAAFDVDSLLMRSTMDVIGRVGFECSFGGVQVRPGGTGNTCGASYGGACKLQVPLRLLVGTLVCLWARLFACGHACLLMGRLFACWPCLGAQSRSATFCSPTRGLQVWLHAWAHRVGGACCAGSCSCPIRRRALPPRPRRLAGLPRDVPWRRRAAGRGGRHISHHHC